MTGAPCELTGAGGALALSGVVTPDSVLALRRDGDARIRQGEGLLELDLAGVTGASSVLLSLLLCWQRLAAAQQRPLRYCNAPDDLVALAVLGGVDHCLAGLQPDSTPEPATDTASHPAAPHPAAG